MQAQVVQASKTLVFEATALPKIAANEILVKTAAVALNPTDWKSLGFIAKAGDLLGCDFSGTVSAVGASATNVKVGDRVAGFVHGGRLPDVGSFAEYVKTEHTLVWKVPAKTSWEEAAAMGGIAPLTAVQALYMRHNLPQPSNPIKDAKPFLVWGGATSVGLYAVQLAKLSGYTVIATASPKNFDLVKSFGADAVYNYADASTPAKIHAEYPTLAHALDTISEKGTTALVSASIGSKKGGGKIVKLLPVEEGDTAGIEGIDVEMTLVYTVLGKSFNMWVDFPANPVDKKAIEEWLPYQSSLVESGKLKSNPIWSQKGGLENIPEGLEILKAGKNSGQKLTYLL